LTYAVALEKSQQLFGDDFRRNQGNQARRYNLLAASLISDIVKSLLGPRGMAKMFVDVLGETTITKSGATLLRKIDVEHPAAKLVIEASNVVDNAVGDGTTSAVVLTGGLVKNADELLVSGISPMLIVEGYAQALGLSLDFLERLAQKTSNSNRQVLTDIAKTCLNSKLVLLNGMPEKAANIIVEAIATISDFQNSSVETDNIKIEEKIGNPSETSLVRGIVIDKTIDSSVMPGAIRNAKILLIDVELDNRKIRGEAEVRVDSHLDLKSFLTGMSDSLKLMIQAIVESGANVVISRKGIGLLAQSMLAQSKIISIKRVKENDLHWIEKATGAKITNDLSINSIRSCLGYAGNVHETLVGEDKMVFIEECVNPKAVTILLRSNSKAILDEFHRTVVDTIHVLQNYIVKPLIVYGGGSLEAIIANRIRKIGNTTFGRQQLVLEKFALALEEIPLTIARNAGMDELNTITELRSMVSRQHDMKLGWYGINAMDRKVEDMRSNMIMEPAVVKEQVLKTAVEVTSILIRVNDVLIKKQVTNTHTHSDGTTHSHSGGNKKHDHFDRLGKQQRPMHHYY
jgi:chaperonin GroEL (HSP60 family)